MGSWRDQMSDQAVTDVEELFDDGLGRAREFLEKYGSFTAFGMTISHDGAPSLLAVEHSSAASGAGAGEALWAELCATGDAHRAVATVSTGHHERIEAIRIEIEHAEGLALLGVQLFQRRAGDQFGWGKIELFGSEPLVWTAV